MSSERDVVEALRHYLAMEESIKEKKKELTDELNAAWETLVGQFEEVGQEKLFKTADEMRGHRAN